MSMKFICSNSSCKYQGGEGYYGLCNHPKKQNQGEYGGITRMLVSGCDLKEKEKDNGKN